jgi:hypothetical protein
VLDIHPSAGFLTQNTRLVTQVYILLSFLPS